MSHYRNVDVEFNDVDCLVAALNELGYKVIEVHSKPQNLRGYKNDIRPQKANVIIRREYLNPASNDLGFEIKDGKATAIISDYDNAVGYGEPFIKKIKAKYAIHKAIKEAKRKGYRIEKKKTQTGTRLVLTK